MKSPAHAEAIEKNIFSIRGQKVMLDRDLAVLYGVETRALVQAVKRNRGRFPQDFMFSLSKDEAKSLASQIVIPSGMLSSILRSKRAIQANIAIMRTFVKMRQALGFQKELAQRLNELENKVVEHDSQIQGIFDALRDLMEPPVQPKPEIGFKAG